MQREFTAVIEKKGRWYVGTVEEIPGVNTQGRTLAEVRRNSEGSNHSDSGDRTRRFSSHIARESSGRSRRSGDR
jgi:hypothetical protein